MVVGRLPIAINDIDDFGGIYNLDEQLLWRLVETCFVAPVSFDRGVRGFIEVSPGSSTDNDGGGVMIEKDDFVPYFYAYLLVFPYL